ncbi:hypothetical protein [Nocardioides sp. CFH 31398]|uniref:hypothetical protein n=1 Tax=Nocardioides sp. CFH 31398 TaxID=2919579 RepID=UPI001F06F8E3|nr:hypothetical protein [Nocardioides sp. CFH 31398]MCH1867192.1 hypothetical protein [Nocardioides sp. CFH 31398]
MEALGAALGGTAGVHDADGTGGSPGDVRLAVDRDRPLDDVERQLVEAAAELVRNALRADREAALADALADLVDRTLPELDAMIGATVEERLVKVARDVGEVMDVKGWSVRILSESEWTMVADENRRGRVPDSMTAWRPFDPRTLELEEGSVVVRPGDGTPVAESLSHCGLTTLLGATGYDPDAVSWTVCMVGDDVSGDLGPGRTALGALVPAALGFPLPPRSGGLLRSTG